MTKEVRTVQEYYIFFKDFPEMIKSDINILNFITSFRNINKGCSCKKRTRVKLCLFNQKKIAQNINENVEKNIIDFYSKTEYKKIKFYIDEKAIKTVNIDE